MPNFDRVPSKYDERWRTGPGEKRKGKRKDNDSISFVRARKKKADAVRM